MKCAMENMKRFKSLTEEQKAWCKMTCDKLHHQVPNPAHIPKMQELCGKMKALIEQNDGDKEKAMCTPEGCDIMCEWTLCCFDCNGDNVLDKCEFAKCCRCMAAKCGMSLTDEACSQKFCVAD